MKKIGIITITEGQNYGNRLQNYAMQSVLSKLNYSPETLVMVADMHPSVIGYMKKGLKTLIYICKTLCAEFCGHTNTKGQRLRRKKFDLYNKRFIIFSRYKLILNSAPSNIEKKYDYFVCGSDQIWNSRIAIIKNNLKNYLASFSKPNQRIAYAASFGTEDVFKDDLELFKKELLNFKAIGVRENSSIKTIFSICERNDVQHVLDPTLLINCKEWVKIEEKPAYIKKQKFIVTYFLGGRSKSVKKHIKEMEEAYNCEAVNLDVEFLRDEDIENLQIFSTSPTEFIWLIHHAECVLTDSFHAIVFSIIFHKPFCAYSREAAEANNDMNGRIRSLFESLSLDIPLSRYEQESIYLKSIDFDILDRIIEDKRSESIEFLRDALQS